MAFILAYDVLTVEGMLTWDANLGMLRSLLGIIHPRLGVGSAFKFLGGPLQADNGFGV